MRWWILLVAFLLALALGRAYFRFFERSLSITFFDVGQGDAALVQFPGGKTLLVDAGGGFQNWNIGSRELVPELTRRGILRLDYALLSHPDQDHGYGFKGIFEKLQVGELWMHAGEPSRGPQRRLTELLEVAAWRTGAQLRRFGRAAVVDVAGARLRLIPLGDRVSSSNDRSLVLALEFAGCRALFTGDMEKPQENILARQWPEPIQILKVAHHGSKTSSTKPWIEVLAPRWAVISVGLPNRYAHPSPEVIQRLVAHQVQLFRTDFHGFVQFRISPTGEIRCRTALGDCGSDNCHRSTSSAPAGTSFPAPAAR
jgi:competence protein ComEC